MQIDIKATIQPLVVDATEHPSKEARPAQINALTSLRFFAALLVVMYHFWVFSASSFPPIVKEIASEGKAAVSFFFILSGFILTYNYYDSFSKSFVNYKKYFRARFARVYPMHLVALLLISPITLYMISSNIPTFTTKHLAQGISGIEVSSSWLANLFLLNIYVPTWSFMDAWNTPSWSISVEFVFYLLFPFFIRYIFTKVKTMKAAIIFILLLFIGQFSMWFLLMNGLFIAKISGFLTLDHVNWIMYNLPLIRLWEFVIGGAFGLLYTFCQKVEYGSKLKTILSKAQFQNLALFFGFLFVFLIIYTPDEERGSLDNYFTWFKNYIIFTPFFALIIFAIAMGKTFGRKLLEHPVLVLLGEASYSLYITHWIIVQLVYLITIQNKEWLTFLVWLGAIVCVLLSILFYKTIEMPARKALRK